MGSKFDLEHAIHILEDEVSRQGTSGDEKTQALSEAVEMLKEANKEHERERKLRRERLLKG